VWQGVQVVGVLVLLVTALWYAGVIELPWEDNREAATVVLAEADGETLTTVDAEVADSRKERRRGLSGHDSLGDGEGMLFVHADEGTRTYVMREMDFAIDMVFVAGNGTVTEIASAPAPGPNEDGESITRSGYARYVLELPRGYADEVGLSVGDVVGIDFENGGTAGEESVAARIATPTSGLAEG
jgi:uncharacterized membrane protein (UPF0127 family)